MAEAVNKLLCPTFLALALTCLGATTILAADPQSGQASASLAEKDSNRDRVIDTINSQTPLNDMRRVNGMVRSFRVPRGVSHTPPEFWNLYGKTLGLGDEDRMVPLPDTPVGQQLGHCRTNRFRHYHRDVPLLNGFYNLVVCNDHVIAGLGEIRPSLAIDTIPRLTPKEALQAAIGAVGRGKRGAETKPIGPARLVIYVPENGRDPSPRLVYRIQIALRNPLGTFEVLINATDGAVVRKLSLSRNVWTEISASGQSVYDGNVSFFAQQHDTGAIRLKSESLFDVQTRNAKGLTTLIGAEDIVINSPTTSEEIKLHGISAHWAALGAWEYFLDKHLWHGIDGSGEHLRVFLNLQYPASAGLPAFGPTNAGWFGPEPFFGDSPAQWQIIALGAGGKDSQGNKFNPLVHPEILAHEMTHAIQYYTVGFEQGFEYDLANPDAGGLSESYADIFGVLAESYIRQTGIDYWIGNEWNENRKRLLYNPALSIPPQPMQYQDAVWNAGAASPDVGIHFYSGPHSRWFYLLAEGEPQVIQGIGPDKAGEIFFYAMTQLLWPTAQYPDALIAEWLAAEILFGQHSQPVVSLLDAAWASGVGSGYANNLNYQPVDQAQDVPPWPVELGWEALGDEVQWQVEICHSKQFEREVITRQTEKITRGSLVQLITLPSHMRPALRADTVYYWRVRGRVSDTGQWQEWRVPVSFKTADQKVLPLSPWTEEKDEYHPWDIPFSWKSLNQAEKYELQLTEGPHHEPANWKQPILTPPTVTGTTVTLDTRVDREQTWRIRALGPDGDFGSNPGVWTEVPFTTTLPRVTLRDPLNGAPRYPWPTELKWEKVVGADHYLIDLTDCDGVFKSANPNSPLPCPELNPNLHYDPLQLGPEVTEFSLNVQPEWLHDNVYYWWQVRVIGPPPWYDEGGLPKQDGQWRVDGAGTIPKKLSHPFSAGNASCMDLEDSITFTWANVLNAEGYQLRINEAWAEPGAQPSGNFTLEHGREIFSQIYFAEPVGHQSETLGNVGNGPMSGPRHLGYWWHIEALGPDGYRGLQDKIGAFYFIESDRPSVKLLDGHQFGLNEEVVLPWKSDHAPFADYKVSVYQGKGCLDSNFLASKVFSGNSPGEGSASISGIQDGGTYSWAVTPAWKMKGQCHQGPIWSACNSFTGPAPICGNGQKEGSEQCDDGNLEEGDGCSSQCKTVLACGQQHGAAGGINLAYTDKPLDLGGNKGTVWITAQTYSIPDRLIFKHGNQTIYEVDCYGTEVEETVAVGITGGSSLLHITVEPGCDSKVPSSGTQWAYTVSCVDDTAPLPDHTPE